MAGVRTKGVAHSCTDQEGTREGRDTDRHSDAAGDSLQQGHDAGETGSHPFGPRSSHAGAANGRGSRRRDNRHPCGEGCIRQPEDGQQGHDGSPHPQPAGRHGVETEIEHDRRGERQAGSS